MQAVSLRASQENEQLERLFAHLSTTRPTSRSLWQHCANSEVYFAESISHYWSNRQTETCVKRRDYDSCSSSSSSSETSDSSCAVSIPATILGGNNAELDANNSQAIDMLNMPSTAETLAKQKNWISIYFRFRMKWHEVQRHLSEMSRVDAYKPENLKLWTRYVKISQKRRVPFQNAVNVFCNRIQCPSVKIKFTLNSFYLPGKENERNRGPLPPIPLPTKKCPDDIPEFRKMTQASVNVFVTSIETYFDEFWKEALEKKPS